MMNDHNNYYQPMTSRNKNLNYHQPKTEYIKEELTLLDRIPTNGGYYQMESEISRSIGQDGEISDIKKPPPQRASHHDYLEF